MPSKAFSFANMSETERLVEHSDFTWYYRWMSELPADCFCRIDMLDGQILLAGPPYPSHENEEVVTQFLKATKRLKFPRTWPVQYKIICGYYYRFEFPYIKTAIGLESTSFYDSKQAFHTFLNNPAVFLVKNTSFK